MPNGTWTKADAELVIETTHKRFGPRRTWKYKTVPAAKGTERRTEYDRMVEELANQLGFAPGGITMTINAVNGPPYADDKVSHYWTYFIVAKALEIGHITAKEAPPIGKASRDGVPDDEN
jgi:hypothetical protein